MKKYILSGSLGISIGLLISLLTSAIFAKGGYSPINPYSEIGLFYSQHFNQVTIMALSAGIWFLIGILFQATDVILSQEWSLLRLSIAHFILSTTGFSILAILAGWFPLNLGNLLVFWLIYLAIYALLYWINYRNMVHKVAQINQSLEK